LNSLIPCLQVSAAALEASLTCCERVREWSRSRVLHRRRWVGCTASHLVNDLRKICEMDAYATDDTTLLKG